MSEQRRTPGGKGDTPRRYNKKVYDANFIKAMGVLCPKCKANTLVINKGKGCGCCVNGIIYDPELYYRLGGV